MSTTKSAAAGDDFVRRRKFVARDVHEAWDRRIRCRQLPGPRREPAEPRALTTNTSEHRACSSMIVARRHHPTRWQGPGRWRGRGEGPFGAGPQTPTSEQRHARHAGSDDAQIARSRVPNPFPPTAAQSCTRMAARARARRGMHAALAILEREHRAHLHRLLLAWLRELRFADRVGRASAARRRP